MLSSNRLQFLALALALPLAVLAIGCAKDDDEEAATASVTSALQPSQHGGITHDIVDVPDDAAIDPTGAALSIASRAPAGITPAGCLVRTRNGATVHIVFAGCTGPFGKLRLDGAMDVTFSLDERNHLVADVVGADDLRANGEPLRYRGHAVVAVHGVTRDVTWHVDAAGKTKRGREYQRSTDLAFTLDVAKKCFAGSGTARGSLAGLDVEVSLENLAVCEHACPKSGAVHAKVRGPLGKEHAVDVSFDGTDQAHVTTPKRTLDVTMDCDDGEAAE